MQQGSAPCLSGYQREVTVPSARDLVCPPATGCRGWEGRVECVLCVLCSLDQLPRLPSGPLSRVVTVTQQICECFQSKRTRCRNRRRRVRSRSLGTASSLLHRIICGVRFCAITLGLCYPCSCLNPAGTRGGQSSFQSEGDVVVHRVASGAARPRTERTLKLWGDGSSTFLAGNQAALYNQSPLPSNRSEDAE